MSVHLTNTCSVAALSDRNRLNCRLVELVIEARRLLSLGADKPVVSVDLVDSMASAHGACSCLIHMQLVAGIARARRRVMMQLAASHHLPPSLLNQPYLTVADTVQVTMRRRRAPRSVCGSAASWVSAPRPAACRKPTLLLSARPPPCTC